MEAIGIESLRIDSDRYLSDYFVHWITGHFID